MKTAAKTIALLALAVTLLVPVLYALRTMDEATMKHSLLVATFAWFAAAPFWLKGGES